MTKPATVQPFAIDEPLVAGVTLVTGKGPANVVIMVVDVTYAGDQLGIGVIRDDGTFSVNVSPPLRESHRIGIMLTAPLPQELEAVKESLAGKGAMAIPTVGVVYASAMTEAQAR